MHKLSDEIVQFFRGQNFVIVSTIDSSGKVHNSCKGIIEIKESGRVYLLDLYRQATFNNLKKDSALSITAVDEHRFRGYCLKGHAEIAPIAEMEPHLIQAWEERIATRITQRVIKNIVGEKGHSRHPEALLPKPEYLIAMDTQEVVDLTPGHISKGV